MTAYARDDYADYAAAMAAEAATRAEAAYDAQAQRAYIASVSEGRSRAQRAPPREADFADFEDERYHDRRYHDRRAGEVDFNALPSCLPSSSWTYVIAIDRTNGRPLGVDADRDGTVTWIGEGLVKDQNRIFGMERVKVGDRLVAVNGIRGDLPLMYELCDWAQCLVLELESERSAAPAVDSCSESHSELCAPAEASAALMSIGDFRMASASSWASLYARFDLASRSSSSSSMGTDDAEADAPVQTAARNVLDAVYKKAGVVAAATITISIDRRQGQNLGMAVCEDDIGVGGLALYVQGIGEGLVQAWNLANPGQEVQIGDRIVTVNGVYGDVPAMVERFINSEVLEMELRRPFASCSAQDEQQMTDDAVQQYSSRAVSMNDRLTQVSAAVSAQVSERMQKSLGYVKERAETVARVPAQVSEKARTAKEMAESTLGMVPVQASEKVRSAKEKVETTFGSVPEKAQKSLDYAKEQASEKVRSAKDQAETARGRAQTASALISACVSETTQKGFDYAKDALRNTRPPRVQSGGA